MNTHSTFFLADAMRDFWFHAPGSRLAEETDNLYMFILWVSIVSFVILMALMFAFVVIYRRRPGVPTVRSAAHNTPLELSWSILPLLTMVPMFFWGFHGYMAKIASPGNAEEIRIVGQQWAWLPEYDNGATPREFVKIGTAESSPVIIVPEGRPVKLKMTSKDVIHSFYIPDFRTKMDVFPNRYTSLNFEPMGLGDHQVYCAEYCGNNHSEMAALIRVLPEEEYELTKKQWGEVDPGAPRYEKGKFWASRFGCTACHSASGAASTGPTWKNMYGYPVQFVDGTARTAREMTSTDFDNYVRESVYIPQAHIVAGFTTTQMNSFQGQVSEEQLTDLIAYMRTLSDKNDQQVEGRSDAGAAGGPAGGAGGSAGPDRTVAPNMPTGNAQPGGLPGGTKPDPTLGPATERKGAQPGTKAEPHG